MAKKKTIKAELQYTAKREETKGIVILAFGKRGYYFAAHNLAKSIKYYSPDIKIALFHDGKLSQLNDTTVFDLVEDLSEKYIYHAGMFCPAKAKVFLHEYTPFCHTLFIDADSLALKDISPLLDRCISGSDYFLASLIASGGKQDKIEYSEWATNETIWEYFNLKEEAVLPALQSTMMYFRKSPEAEKFYKTLKENFNFPLEKLKERWGGGLPDELIFSGTCAQLGLLPNLKDAVFFGHSLSTLSFTELEEKYYFLTLYGNGIGIPKTKIRYIQWYDSLMHRKITNRGHVYGSQYIMNDKHANNRNQQ